MTGPLQYPESKPRARRRWVRVLVIVAVVVALLVVAVLVIGGGRDGHGPKRHTGFSPAPAAEA
jgi:ABC-type transporter Mla subunit MlaD